jgi:drug/metabolite transporter (DMT)-like permease
MHNPHEAEHASGRLLTMAALVGLFIIWSNSFHAISYFRQGLHVSATSLVSLRYGLAEPFCLIYCLIRWRDLKALLARDLWRVLLMGALMVPGYNLSLNWGQGRVPPATASLIIAMNPVFTYILAILFLKERARWSKILGMAVAFAGIYLLVSTQNRSWGSGYAWSALVVLMAPLSWAASTVTAKPVTARAEPLLLTFAATGIGSLPFFLTLLCGTGGVHQVLRTMSATGWIALLHLSLLCTVVGFAVWFWALRRLSASSTAAFVFLNPPLTALFGVLWGTERLHWSTVLFGCITLAGVALSSGLFRRRRETVLTI